jgi:hypothetical protein
MVSILAESGEPKAPRYEGGGARPGFTGARQAAAKGEDIRANLKVRLEDIVAEEKVEATAPREKLPAEMALKKERPLIWPLRPYMATARPDLRATRRQRVIRSLR